MSKSTAVLETVHGTIEFEFLEDKAPGSKVQIEEAFFWLQGNPDAFDAFDGDEKMRGYRLPAKFDTWRVSVTKARSIIGKKDYGCGGAHTTGSIRAAADL